MSGASWISSGEPTATQREGFRIAGEAFAAERAKLAALASGEIAELERALEAAGAPWTPGRLPEWKPEP